MSKPTDLFGCDPDFVAAPSDYEMGYALGVKAAREAVAALSPPWSVKFYVNRPSNGEWIGCNGAHEQVDVLAAIDALTTRGKEGR